MSASNWFGDLQLAYKYIVVFMSLLGLVIIAGFIKVLFDRRKLKKSTEKEELEAGPREDTVELNQREKDEGDLFGIRAIEAGFYAGVAQSAPTSRAVSRAGSRAGSVVNLPTAQMSTSTLVGGMNSPFVKGGYSGNSSVLSLNLNKSTSPDRDTSPPSKLRPSQAELTGRHEAVETSPTYTQQRRSPSNRSTSSSGSNSSPESISPRSGEFPHTQQPQHYAPTPLPSRLQPTYHSLPSPNPRSQEASFNSSPAHSPLQSTLPSPGAPPTTSLPTLPRTVYSRDPSPTSR